MVVNFGIKKPIKVMKSFITLSLISVCLGSCNNNATQPLVTVTQKNIEPQILNVKTNDNKDLNAALEQAKQLLAQGNNVEIRLSAGTYYLDTPIKLENHGSNKLSIIGSDNGETVISGAIELTPKWQKFNENIYQAKLDVEKVDQLYVSGLQQIRARYPNFRADARVFNGYAADALSPERTKHWGDPTGGYVHALHKGKWGGMHYEITGKEPDGNWTLAGGFQNNRASPLHQQYRFVENVFEELDAPKEWFFDVKTQTLYFYPDSLDISQVKTIEVPRLKHLIEIIGSAEKPFKNIAVRNITFTHTAHTFMETKEPLLRSDWTIYRGAAITLDNTEHIEIKENKLVNLGGNAIAINRLANDITISDNHISHIGAGAINFVGDPSAVRSPSFNYEEFVDIDDMDFGLGPKNNQYPRNSLVRNNLIHDIGRVEKQVAGVQISMASSITISHNSIYRVPRAGINISEGTWGGHLIEFNDVFNTVLETGDHGAFNSWGRDRFWHPNRSKMNKIYEQYPDLYKQDAVDTITIRNNRFQSDYGWDIDLDDGSSNYDIYNNVMLAGGLKLREGFRRHAYNNIMINNAFHPHVWFENSQDEVTHNIVLVSHKPVSNYQWGNEVDYNFFTTESALDKAKTLGLDQHSTFGDPMFIDPEHGDYRVAADSKALAVGFKNFPMDNFGVASPSLKLLAETPTFPELFLDRAGDSASKVYDFLGAKIKSVETLGEQSALGLPEVSGVMVLSVDEGSVMQRGGLQANDVILGAYAQDKIATSQDLLRSYQTGKWRKKMRLSISRNQSMTSLTINAHAGD